MPPGAMTTAEARLINPVLTNVARGYQDKEELVFPHLFPIVEVEQRGGTLVKFDAANYEKYDTQRAPGAAIPEIELNYSDETYVCVQRALSGVIPVEKVEEAAAVPGINARAVQVRRVMRILRRQIEVAATKIATDANNYSASHHVALAGAGRWDNDDSTPNKEVETLCQKIREGVGVEPNVLILGAKVYGALRNHKKVLDQIIPTEGLDENGMPLINEMKLAAYFGVKKVIVGRAMAGKPGEFEDLWGKNAVLAFSDVSSLADMGSESFGYTYRVRGYPVAEEGWLDKSRRTWKYNVFTEDTPVIAMKDAGALLTSVVA